MSADAPVLDALTDMVTASVEHNPLSPRDYMLGHVISAPADDRVGLRVLAVAHPPGVTWEA